MEEQLIITKETLKVLSSEMRLKILKALEKPKTQTDLAHLLNLKLPTIKEHLDHLEKEELVQKNEERKWKYYSLTEKGKLLLNPENKLVKILLFSLTAFSLASVLTYYLKPKPAILYSTSSQSATVFAESAKMYPPAPIYDPLLYLFLALTFLSFLLVLYFKFKKAKSF